MSEALIMYGDSDTSTDLFAAVGANIVDPFLYVEVGGRRVVVIGALDHQTVRAADPGLAVFDTAAYGRKELMLSGMDHTESGLEVALRALRDLGVTTAVVSWDFPVALADRIRGDGREVRVDHNAFAARRRVKTPQQLVGIRRAQAAADAAMGAAAELVRACEAGLTAAAVRGEMQRVCAEAETELPDDVIVAVNAQAASGHDSGSGPIAAGDIVLIDIWPRDRRTRCWADMTRTFVAGGAEPDPELAGYWALCLQALEATTAATRAGAHGRAIYDIAAEIFERAGHPTARSAPDGLVEGFFHGLGHGVGLDIHEAPSLGLAGDALVAGDVITLEPGCYRPGYGGVRLEDLLLVTEDGCEVLTRFPYEL